MPELYLPFPPRELFPNFKNGRHFGATLKIKKSYREHCFYLAKIGEKPSTSSKIQIKIIFCHPDNRQRDIDNCLSACKALIDGVAEAWGINDRLFRPILLDDGDVVKNGKVILQW